MNGVVLLTRQSPYGQHLAARFQTRLRTEGETLAGIIAIDAPPSAAPPWYTQLARQLKLTAVLRRISPTRRLRHQIWRHQQHADAYFRSEAGPTPDWPKGIDRLDCTPSAVNDTATVDWAAQRHPRLLVVSGAPILKAPILSVATQGTVNMHSSVLPRYRGTSAEFWQVHNRDLKDLGISFHYVDEAVDTGALIASVRQQTKITEGPWKMRARNQLNGLQHYPEIVVQILQETATSTPQPPGDERPYRFSDITPEAQRRVLANMGCRS